MSPALLVAALALFASMFLPLPAPLGLAISLWALGAGVPLPLVLALYLTQDLVIYSAIRRLAPALAHGPAANIAAHLPPPIRSFAARALRPATAESALLPAALLSFYAGVALATMRRTAALRSAAIVIGVDVLKYANALAVALGAARLLPRSPLATVAAPLAGFAAALAVAGALRCVRAVGGGQWDVVRQPLGLDA